jgi:hypothetical protein
MYFFVLAIWAWNIYLFRLAYISIFRPSVPLENESSSDEDTGTPVFSEPE